MSEAARDELRIVSHFPGRLRVRAETFRVLPEVAERCLNHTEENRVKRIYQRYAYEAEMKLAWERLGNHLEQLTKSSEGKINE